MEGESTHDRQFLPCSFAERIVNVKECKGSGRVGESRRQAGTEVDFFLSWGDGVMEGGRGALSGELARRKGCPHTISHLFVPPIVLGRGRSTTDRLLRFPTPTMNPECVTTVPAPTDNSRATMGAAIQDDQRYSYSIYTSLISFSSAHRPNLYEPPYVSPALRSMISRSGPSNRVNACASSPAHLSFGRDGSERRTALTVAALGASCSSESSTHVGAVSAPQPTRARMRIEMGAHLRNSRPS
jgi:hypothetical protein